MEIAFLSLTGNVRSFVEKLEYASTEIPYSNPFVKMNNDFIVIVPSYDDEITEIINDFLTYESNINYLRGVAGSGSLNYNKQFCFNANEIAKKFDVPLIYKFEFSGIEQDAINFKEEVKLIEVTRTTKEN